MPPLPCNAMPRLLLNVIVVVVPKLPPFKVIAPFELFAFAATPRAYSEAVATKPPVIKIGPDQLLMPAKVNVPEPLFVKPKLPLIEATFCNVPDWAFSTTFKFVPLA